MIYLIPSSFLLAVVSAVAVICTNAAGCGGGGTLAPWYTYWPYCAHFQTPAVPNFPYWPPMTTSLSQPPAPAVYPAAYPPVGSYANWPSYWYGH